MSSKSRQDLESWIKTLDVSGKVLDIGGSQFPVKGRTKTWAVEEYKIMDLLFPHEVKQVPDYVCSIEERGCLRVPLNHFDTIFCLELMEYVIDPMAVLENIMRLGNDTCTVYITSHWLYGLHKPKGEDCIRYSKNGFERLCNRTGWVVAECITREISFHGKQWIKQFYGAEGMKISDEESTYDEGHLWILKRRQL